MNLTRKMNPRNQPALPALIACLLLRMLLAPRQPLLTNGSRTKQLRTFQKMFSRDSRVFTKLFRNQPYISGKNRVLFWRNFNSSLYMPLGPMMQEWDFRRNRLGGLPSELPGTLVPISQSTLSPDRLRFFSKLFKGLFDKADTPFSVQFETDANIIVCMNFFAHSGKKYMNFQVVNLMGNPIYTAKNLEVEMIFQKSDMINLRVVSTKPSVVQPLELRFFYTYWLQINYILDRTIDIGWVSEHLSITNVTFWRTISTSINA